MLRLGLGLNFKLLCLGLEVQGLGFVSDLDV